MPESIQFDHPLREAGNPVFGYFVNEIPILLLEYEYRFTEYEYEYEKNQWYELPATIMPDGPVNFSASQKKILAEKISFGARAPARNCLLEIARRHGLEVRGQTHICPS